jgi:hypothetical protein
MFCLQGHDTRSWAASCAGGLVLTATDLMEFPFVCLGVRAAPRLLSPPGRRMSISSFAIHPPRAAGGCAGRCLRRLPTWPVFERVVLSLAPTPASTPRSLASAVFHSNSLLSVLLFLSWKSRASFSLKGIAETDQRVPSPMPRLLPKALRLNLLHYQACSILHWALVSSLPLR